MPIEWTSGSWFLELLNWSVAFWNDVVGLGVGLLTQSPEQISPGIWNIIRAISDSLQGIGYGLLEKYLWAMLKSRMLTPWRRTVSFPNTHYNLLLEEEKEEGGKKHGNQLSKKERLSGQP